MTSSPAPAPVRSAIVGTGFMGDVHSRAVRAAGGSVAVVIGRSPDTTAEAADRFGAATWYTSLEDALAAGGIDVVHVCTPNSTHVELARQAIQAGVHVVCEKPVATSTEDARDLVDRATEAGVVNAVPFAYRFYGSVREARARVRAGTPTDVRLIHGSYLQDWLSRPEDTSWRIDPALGGRSRAFADIGVHWCDLVEFVTGHRITRLNAQLMVLPRTGASASGTEDAAVIQFVTDHGALGSTVISQVSPGRKNRLWFSIDTAQASYQFDQEVPESLWIGGRDQNVVLPRATEDATTGVRYDLVPAGHPQGYQDCFTNFMRDVHDAVRGESPDGLPIFADGLRAASLTEAVLESAHTGTWAEPSTFLSDCDHQE